MSKWIDFVDRGASESGKTRRVEIITIDGASRLGWITWYGPWRKYAFEPERATVFEEECLRAIATHCQSMTIEHRAAAKQAKADLAG